MRLTRRFRHWFPVLPLLALLGATYWLDKQAQPDPDVPASAARHDPDAIVDGFSAINLNKSGTPSFILHADKMLHYSDDDSSTLSAPRITLLDEDNLPLYASAQAGDISSKGSVVILSGGVAVQRDTGNDGGPMNLRTEYLRVFPERGLMDTDKAVQLTEAHAVVNGVGLELDNNTKTLRLRSQVRTEYAAR